MRLLTLAGLTLLVGCGPGVDPLIGSYTFALTGLDTNTAPNMNTSTPMGAGTLAVTANAALTGYVVTAAQTDADPCVLVGKAAEKAAAPEITITADQKCVFTEGPTTTTASFTTGKSVLKLSDTRAMDVMTLEVSYSYAGSTTVLGFTTSFAGTGKRTYTGTRR
jgi:hypothetical protein